VKPTTDLHDLLQSLSASEKGYFKKFCLRNGGGASKKYIHLFDSVAAQKMYDEDKLKKKLKDAALVRNLSSEKNYLYHLILESLITSGSGQFQATALEQEMHKARILSERSFHSMAQRFLEKIIGQCRETDNFNLWLDAIDLEIQIWQYIAAAERRGTGALFKEKEHILAAIALSDKAKFLHASIIDLFQSIGVGRSKEQLERYEKINTENKKLLKKGDGLSITARVLCLNTAVFYYNVTGSIDLAYKTLRDLIQLVETREHLLTERMSFYISTLNNYILTALYLGKFDDARSSIEKLDKLPANSPRNKATVFVCRYNTRFELYAKTGAYDEAYELSEEMRKEAEGQKFKVGIDFTAHIRYYSFRAAFIKAKYKDALAWINGLLNAGKGTVRQEVVTIARISELMLHYEMENDDLLANLVGSAQRFLSKNNSLYEFEKLMLEFFRHAPDKGNAKAAFAELYDKLTGLKENILEQRVMDYFDFTAWAESRKTGRSLEQVMKDDLTR
jgi:hypothetical protein